MEFGEPGSQGLQFCGGRSGNHRRCSEGERMLTEKDSAYVLLIGLGLWIADRAVQELRRLREELAQIGIALFMLGPGAFAAQRDVLLAKGSRSGASGGLRVEARRGRVCLFFNVDDNGEVDHASEIFRLQPAEILRVHGRQDHRAGGLKRLPTYLALPIHGPVPRR